MRKFGRRANLIGQGKPPRSRISFLVCLRVMAGVLARGSYERRDKHASKEYGRKDAAKTDPQQGRVVRRTRLTRCQWCVLMRNFVCKCVGSRRSGGRGFQTRKFCRYVVFRCCGVVDVFTRPNAGRIRAGACAVMMAVFWMDADRREKWRPRCAEKTAQAMARREHLLHLSSGETAGNQAVRQVSGPSRRPSGTSLGVAGRTEINWCHKPKQMSFLKISWCTSRKEISWCNKARLYGVRQLQGPEPWFGPASPRLGAPTRAPQQGLGWAWGPGPQRLGARAARDLGPGRGGSQLNNYDETRSDHGPVGNTWLCYILVIIDYATYL